MPFSSILFMYIYSMNSQKNLKTVNHNIRKKIYKHLQYLLKMRFYNWVWLAHNAHCAERESEISKVYGKYYKKFSEVFVSPPCGSIYLAAFEFNLTM